MSKAQININLLVPKEPHNTRLLYWGTGFIIMAIIGGLIGFAYTSLIKELNHQKVVNTELKSVLNKYNNEIVRQKPIRDLQIELARQSQAVADIQKEQVSYSSLITALDEVKPPELLVVGLDIKAPKIVMNGFSPDHSQIARLMEGLQRDLGFDHVEVLTSVTDEESGEAKFTLELAWEVPGK